jgi:hypothetical protein
VGKEGGRRLLVEEGAVDARSRTEWSSRARLTRTLSSRPMLEEEERKGTGTKLRARPYGEPQPRL